MRSTDALHGSSAKHVCGGRSDICTALGIGEQVEGEMGAACAGAGLGAAAVAVEAELVRGRVHVIEDLTLIEDAGPGDIAPSRV